MIRNKYFTTIEKSICVKDIFKNSRFITLVKEVEKEEEIRAFLKDAKNQFPDASHHCWAYKIGINDQERKQFSDAGEPANSAGPPILQAIQHEQLINVMVIVVRYFGGIKLGISGLIRAYRESALHGLKLASRVEKIALKEFMLEKVHYQELGKIIHATESRKGRIAQIDYEDTITVLAYLPESDEAWLSNVTKNISHGRITNKPGSVKWFTFIE